MNPSHNFQSTISFSEVHKERVGQLINYLAYRLKNLYCTKLIKLLYIIDEESIIKTGTPISWLTYYVYKMGPVSEKIWFSIKDGNTIFGDYFNVDEEKGGGDEDGGVNYRISPISTPELSEFSKREIEIIDEIIEKFGLKTPEQLIEYLHRKDSLWFKIVEDKKLKFDKSFASTYEIDLSQHLNADKDKLEKYHDTVEEIFLLDSLS